MSIAITKNNIQLFGSSFIYKNLYENQKIINCLAKFYFVRHVDTWKKDKDYYIKIRFNN